MKIDMNSIFDDISVENAELIKSQLDVQLKSPNKKKVHFAKPFIAVAAAACIMLSAGVVTYYRAGKNELQPNIDSNVISTNENISKGFSVMQVYASDEIIEITDNTVETQAPFYKIIIKPCNWYQADKLINESADAKNKKLEYYQYGKYDDAHKSNGYIVTTEYGNYFDVKGDNITALSVKAEKGYVFCSFEKSMIDNNGNNSDFANEYMNMNKDGGFVGGESIELDSSKLALTHKIMWEPSHIINIDKFESKGFDYDSFKYSDLNDVLTFTVTIDENGKERTETVNVEISFDEEGVMHANIK